MRSRWVVLVLCGALVLGCEHQSQAEDDGSTFLGDWECASGTRRIDCGEGVVVADLALGSPDVIRFVDGTATDLWLRIPSTVLVPGLPGGPICDLGCDAASGTAGLTAESVCPGQDESIVVHEALARHSMTMPGQITLSVVSTTSRGCAVDTLQRCFPSR